MLSEKEEEDHKGRGDGSPTGSKINNNINQIKKNKKRGRLLEKERTPNKGNRKKIVR